MKTPKVQVDTSGTEAANAAVAKAQEAANNLQKNFAADLKTQNIASVVAGDAVDAVVPDQASGRKKRQGTGLASQLGINV